MPQKPIQVCMVHKLDILVILLLKLTRAKIGMTSYFFILFRHKLAYMHAADDHSSFRNPSDCFDLVLIKGTCLTLEKYIKRGIYSVRTP